MGSDYEIFLNFEYIQDRFGREKVIKKELWQKRKKLK